MYNVVRKADNELLIIYKVHIKIIERWGDVISPRY